MKLLLDECLHPEVARLLVEAGHDVVTVVTLDMVGAADPEVFAVARQQERILVTLDTDFGELLVRPPAGDRPSVVLIRRPPTAGNFGCRGRRPRLLRRCTRIRRLGRGGRTHSALA